MQASLPGDEVRLARRAIAQPADVAAQTDSPLVVVIIQRYNMDAFPTAASLPQARQVANGVVVVNGPPAVPSVPVGPTPRADTDRWGILLTGATVVALLLACGLGWALVLLPWDPVTVTGLAPALGAAAIILVALAWDTVGLPLHGPDALGPLVVAGAAGWLVWWLRRSRAPEPGHAT